MRPSPVGRSPRRAYHVVAIYALFAMLWIFGTDTLLGRLVSDPALITRLAVAKGFLFVAVTSLILYYLVTRYLRWGVTTERALDVSEGKFRSYVENAPIAIFVITDEPRCVDFNSAAIDLLGHDPESLLKLRFHEVLMEGRLPMAMANLEKLKRSGRVSGEFTFVRRDGTPIRVLLRAVKLQDNRYIAFCQDITEQARSIDALRASEARFRSLFTNMLEGFAYCRILYQGGAARDFEFLDVNESFERLTGLSGVAGRKMSEVIPGLLETQPELLATYARVAAGGFPERFDFLVEALRLYLHISVYSTEKGRFITVFDNITERKKSEDQRDATLQILRICNESSSVRELLRKLTLYLRDLTRCDAVGVRLGEGDDFPYYETQGSPPEFVLRENTLCAVNENGEIDKDGQGNPILECMCGRVISGTYDPSRPYFTINGSFWTASTTDLLDTSAEEDLDGRVRNRCSGEGYESVALIPLKTQGRTLGLMQFNDRQRGRITADTVTRLEELISYAAIALSKLKADEALAEAAQFSMQVIESAEGGIVVYSRDLRYIVFNPFMERITGMPARDMIGKHPWDVFPFLRKEGAVLRMQQALAGKTAPTVDMPYFIPRNGRSGWCSNSYAPLCNMHGEVIGVIGTIRDITEQKLAEEQLARTNEMLIQAEKLEAVGRLAGGVAHDFNNILTAIYGYSDILLSQLPEGRTERTYVGEIKKSAQRAAALTQQLLAFSRRQTLKPRDVDLNALVGNLKAMLGRLIGEDITVETVPAEDLWTAQADPSRIEQALINLAVNARDAMPRGGKLTIGTENALLDAAYAARHADATPGGFVAISVTDTGTGMNAEVLSHLFEPFFTTKEQGKGTGLGLSTVYGIVRQSGGSITVESEIGKGSTFKIYLPHGAEGLAAREEQEAVQESMARGRETILYVEDDDYVRTLVTMILRGNGYTVIVAENGDEGLRVAAPYMDSIALVLTDVIMPRMGGKEMVDRLVEQKPGLKAVYMSGYTDDTITRHHVLEKGIDLIEKPVNAETLLTKVREVLDGKRS